MATNMWKNSLKNVECDNNKIIYETLLDFFLQRNGTYCLNRPVVTGLKSSATGVVILSLLISTGEKHAILANTMRILYNLF